MGILGVGIGGEESLCDHTETCGSFTLDCEVADRSDNSVHREECEDGRLSTGADGPKTQSETGKAHQGDILFRRVLHQYGEH